MTQRVAVLGSGPVGLEAAAAAALAGHEVTLIERGDVAQHVADWGHVRLFSPFAMNAGPAGRTLLGTLPFDDDARPTGRELRKGYLLPLAEALRGKGTLRAFTRVVAVSRTRFLKHEGLGDDARARDPFRLLVEHQSREQTVDADVVLDCTGTFGRPNRIGPGGGPALGERTHAQHVRYGLPDVLGADRPRYAGVRTLLVGSGHSAATLALALAELAGQQAGTTFLWAARRERGPAPFSPLGDDPLPARAELETRANALAQDPPDRCDFVGGASVRAIETADDGVGLFVTLETPAGDRKERVQRIIAATGGEPDDSIYRQLQIHECYASRAPMKLAAHLLSLSGDAAGDCLATGGAGIDLLRSPEPAYFILGAKSFGRNSAFLMRTGYEQVESAIGSLA